MATSIKVGQKATFKGKEGLGQAARTADPDVPQSDNPLRSDMAEIDLKPGTAVQVIGHDDDRDLVLLQWEDGQGNPRITSVTEDDFRAQFGGK